MPPIPAACGIMLPGLQEIAWLTKAISTMIPTRAAPRVRTQALTIETNEIPLFLADSVAESVAIVPRNQDGGKVYIQNNRILCSRSRFISSACTCLQDDCICFF